MKQIIKSNLVLLTLLFFTLSGCSKDDDTAPAPDKSKLLGKWAIAGIYKEDQNIMDPNTDEQESYVVFDEEKSIQGIKHQGDGNFEARLDYDNTTAHFLSYWNLINSNTIRINNAFDLKIRKNTASELNFEIEDDEYGWLEVRCIR